MFFTYVSSIAVKVRKMPVVSGCERSKNRDFYMDLTLH